MWGPRRPGSQPPPDSQPGQWGVNPGVRGPSPLLSPPRPAPSPSLPSALSHPHPKTPASPSPPSSALPGMGNQAALITGSGCHGSRDDFVSDFPSNAGGGGGGGCKGSVTAAGV